MRITIKMAPQWPEEVDVFSVPHSRMKKLVEDYRHLVSSTDFSNEYHMTDLLQNLINVFLEFKNHEQIENTFIMKRLRRKLRAASVTSEAVCNCHNDNRLTEMLDLVLNGYRMAQRTAKERQAYGRKLQLALEDFTQNFIPHMEEEEEVFQPMLIKYFSYEELKELKASVIHQHSVSKQQGGEYRHEKCVAELYQNEESTKASSECVADKLPNEVFNKIFKYLSPLDLCRASRVSRRWSDLAMDPLLWPAIYPVHWARGNWTFDPQPLGGVDGLGDDADDELRFYDELDGEYTCTIDEDADVDELEDEDKDDDSPYGMKRNKVLKEARMLTGMVKSLLHRVGSGIKTVDVAHSKGISSSLLHKILKLCKNVEVLDVTHTQVGDAAFLESGLIQSKLRHLDLTGCQNVTDQSLLSLAGIRCNDCKAFGDSNEKFDAPDVSQEYETVEIENVPPPCGEKKATCCGRGGMYGALDVHPSSTGSYEEIRDNCSERSSQEVVTSVVVKDCSKKTSCCSKRQCNRIQDKLNNSATTQSSSQNALNDLHVAYFEESGIVGNSSSSSFVSNMCCGPASEIAETEKNVTSKPTKSLCSSSPLGSTCSRGNCGYCAGCDWASTCPLALALSLHDGLPVNEFRCDCPEACLSTNSSTEPPSCCHGDSAGDDATTTSSYSYSHSGSSEEKCGTDWCTAADQAVARQVPPLEFLSLNGCFNISDDGLIALAEGVGTPYLKHLDLSGCMGVTGYGITRLMATCEDLGHSNLFYCDNIPDDPYPRTACGCRNLESGSRYCCTMNLRE